MKKLQPKELRRKTAKELEEMKERLNIALAESYGRMNKESSKLDMLTIRRNIARINTIQNERTRRTTQKETGKKV